MITDENPTDDAIESGIVHLINMAICITIAVVITVWTFVYFNCLR